MKINSGNSLPPQSSAIKQSQETQKKLFEQIATGLKINSAKDDAAGLQLANRLGSQISGLQQAYRNTNDAVSFAQVAEGALQSVTDVSFRIEELSIQAANGTLSADQRQAIQAEVSQLQDQIGTVFEQTRFGDSPVFGSSVSFQTGANTGEQIDLATSATSLAVIDVTTAQGAQQAIGSISDFRQQVDQQRSAIGAFQNRLGSTLGNIANQVENSAASRSQITDTDYAVAVSEKVKNETLINAATTLQAQANFSNRSVLNLL